MPGRGRGFLPGKSGVYRYSALCTLLSKFFASLSSLDPTSQKSRVQIVELLVTGRRFLNGSVNHFPDAATSAQQIVPLEHDVQNRHRTSAAPTNPVNFHAHSP